MDIPEHRLIFSGSDYTPLCVPCSEGTPSLGECCDPCRLAFLHTDTFGTFDGFGGTVPTPRTREDGRTLIAETVDVRESLRERVIALAPVPSGSRPGWLMLTESWRLVVLELPRGVILAEHPVIPAERIPRPVPDPRYPSNTPHPKLLVSPDGRFAAVLLERTRHGVIVDLADGATLAVLDRGDYHPDVSGWPFAFFTRDGRAHAIHAIDWNRLAVVDLERGTTLASESEEQGDDYFLGPITVNPSGTWLATAGWVWQPVGILRVRSIETLLGDVVEDRMYRYLNQTGYHWNGPNLWLDDARILVWGLGDDDQRMVDAGVVFDLSRASNEITGLWPGLPYGSLHADPRESRIWCCSRSTTSIWDAVTGERLAQVAAETSAFHPTLRHAAGILEDGRISLAFLQRG